ncbi:hypothetical protein CDAR_266271 [Caerostris darwini]|uniref:Uncharacterized protein n=1 Tax=Caerostris darwini TaxID=1538125 RepID=A0AAV4MLC3_9ARAC|nr:hypothetical protein CDAR_266271 [Caerostris darwini]
MRTESKLLCIRISDSPTLVFEQSGAHNYRPNRSRIMRSWIVRSQGRFGSMPVPRYPRKSRITITITMNCNNNLARALQRAPEFMVAAKGTKSFKAIVSL